MSRVLYVPGSSPDYCLLLTLYSQIPWLRSTPQRNYVAEAEAFEIRDSASSSFELLEDGNLLRQQPSIPPETIRYADGSTIDWQREEAAERERKRTVHTRRGWRGALSPILDGGRIWLVIVFTGIGIGVAGAWLDVLVRW